MKDFYLQTFLEALSEVPWTRGKKRAVLSKLEADGLAPYQFRYAVPVDCARPLEIQENAYFVAEGNCILTDRDNAALLYVTNGRIADEAAYLGQDDYPEYDPPEYEPKFYEYVERMLASKLAAKLEKNPGLRQALHALAMQIKREAIAASRSTAAAEKNGNEWWFDRMGIHYG
jgi:hypothetical protein